MKITRFTMVVEPWRFANPEAPIETIQLRTTIETDGFQPIHREEIVRLNDFESLFDYIWMGAKKEIESAIANLKVSIVEDSPNGH